MDRRQFLSSATSAVLLSACDSLPTDPVASQSEADLTGTSRPIKYVACGDSITAQRDGVIVYCDLLAARDIDKFLMLQNSGHPSWTILDIAKRLDRMALNYLPETVSLMFGTNDHFWPTDADGPRVSLAQFEATYRSVTDRIGKTIICATDRIYMPRLVLLTPPFVTSGATKNSDRLSTYADVVRRIASEIGASLVDVFQVTGDLCGWDRLAFYHDWSLDGTHLNSAAHEAIYPYIRDAVLG